MRLTASVRRILRAKARLGDALSASVAVYLHAECARQVSEIYGDAATLASDLLRALPEARKLLDAPAVQPMRSPGAPMGV